MRVFLAGRVAVEVEGVLIDEKRFPGRQGRLLFAYLVAEQGRAVPRAELADALWGEAPPPTWEKALTVNMSKLRGLLAESGANGLNTLTSAFGCYRLELPEGTWVDVIAAADAAAEAEAALAAGDPEGAKERAAQSASLARPRFLPGAEGSWVDGKRAELADILHRALSCLAEASLRAGDPSAAGKAAEESIGLEPYRESGYRHLMQAHAAAGNRAEALRVYERCRKLLAEELGAYPSPETESFYRELLAASPIETKAQTLHDADERPKTDYAKSGDVHIAYQCLGDGPVNLVFVPGFVSHVEHFWEDPALAGFLRRLASFSRLVFFDKRGTGLSDRVSEAAVPTLEERMDDVRAVMDAVGFERAAILAPSDAGSMAILFAATYPERTTSLVLWGTFAAGVQEPDYPWGAPAAAYDEMAERWREQWGRVVFFLDRFAPSKVGDERYKEWLGRLERLSASPGAAAMLARMNGDIDVRHVLPSVSVPTLVLHRRGELVVPVDEGRFIAEHIPGAKFVELDGVDHWPWLADADSAIEQIQEFVTGTHEPPELDRVLATVLFMDIVDATQHAVVRNELSRFRGREIDNSGDGLFAVFDGPARAIKCACAIVEGMKPRGLDARAGLHTGECELIGDKVGGIAVQLSARVAAKAGPGEVLVSRTVKDLVAGSGIEFVDRGVHRLKGVPDECQLLAVKREVRSEVGKRARAPIRLVLAEDHYLVREGTLRLLEARPDLDVVAVCDDLSSLLAAVEAEQPDVVLTDIRMPPSDTDEGIRAAARLRDTHPEIGVVVLSQYANPSYALALLEGGSAGRAYLLKERVKDLDELEAAIRAVAEGGSVIDAKVVDALVAENTRGEHSPLRELTPRERDVLREMAEGRNNAAIADALSLTERSVEKVIHSIFLKLGLTWEAAVHKRVKAVILYLAEGT